VRVNNIKIIKKNIISKGKGEIRKYISKKDNFLKSFGEVYFSKIFKKYRKGWIFHKKNTCIFICIYGSVKFHFVDIFKKEKKLLINAKSGKILIVPPKLWFSIESKEKFSIVANTLNFPHKDNEVNKKSIKKLPV
tara:strand:+ start:912 stop:1316 length:405 start_codon:yes stop_codon:yes gene_type:complete